MKLTMGTRLALAVAAGALLLVLAFNGTLPRQSMVVGGIAVCSIAAVSLLARAAKVHGQREAVPSVIWALAMLAFIGALGWDMRLAILGGVLSVLGAVFGRKYRVAL